MNWDKVGEFVLDMKPEIKKIPQKYLVGISAQMSLSENRTKELWQTLMPRRREIKNRIGTDRISMQVYDESWDYEKFSPTTKFTRWAGLEVLSFANVPAGLETHVLTGGKYAVFHHKGPVTTFPKTWDYIFNEWLPESGYELDKREHFEVLGKDYKPLDPDAEEKVWIPIKNSSGGAL